MSSYLEDQLLNWIKGAAFVAAPANLYAALYTANPTDANASGTEVTGNAYARVAIAAAGWSAIAAAAAGTGDSITNSGIVTFATPTPAGWGTVTGFALYDALTVGNEIVWAALSASKVINAGDTVTFAVGALAIFFD
jgi:hypothetical protein